MRRGMRFPVSCVAPMSSLMDIRLVFMPYFYCMKMTMHIDEDLLRRVMAATGVTSKTRAVDLALREIDRRAELIRLAREGLGMTPEELSIAFHSASDPDSTLYCAEKRRTHGRKSRSR
jgi:Arc/MetJ family transcription regulator